MRPILLPWGPDGVFTRKEHLQRPLRHHRDVGHEVEAEDQHEGQNDDRSGAPLKHARQGIFTGAIFLFVVSSDLLLFGS